MSNVVETKDLIDILILEKASYLLVHHKNGSSIFGKFFKVNNIALGQMFALTLVLEDHTGKFADIFVDAIESIEILKVHKNFKVIL